MTDDRTLESRRELENLRLRYHEHRRTIRHLLQTAPDERLATRYEATLTELQKSIDQLDRIDREAPEEQEPFDPNQTRAIKPGAIPGEPETLSTKPVRSFEDAEFATQDRSWNDPVVRDASEHATTHETSGPRSSSMVAWIAGIIILIALAIGAVMFWPDSDDAQDARSGTETIVEQTEVEEEPPPPVLLSAEPATYDFGVIQKGTRSVHRFTLRNRTDQPLAISVGRSECRCLWYEYPPQIPAGASAELAITVDGARADNGVLRETVVLTSNADPDVRAEIDLTANIAAP